ncbi:MAG TPA: bifunctional diaminohydroxyphosphoribosylaminopyrimidine deaminase/5-amino-6-(5-phosphoribosylamino)uracil reductase RibD [Pyrinomonadaceae bacterium]|nr:bifunctional diaminohydroxyphosphoribosylaminopyrimidine deaminase/5-amino-6-(5-phosphoribosylamino)uracil reductase RibD [Pyrinomonadaceae bacterium]
MKKDFSEFDVKMTRRALELAACGIGQVSPSPLVGCAIVAENDEVVGEGCYVYENVTHAEVLALQQAGERAKGATAYVSLEPHAHHGRTMPCTDALINAGIKRVVCPIEDPNPLVSGKGFQVLRENGMDVVTGILKAEAERQNEKFIHWHKAKRPFVHLKTAISLDGHIATRTGDSRWISGEESRQKSHDLRHEYDAILIGANTATVDNPSLTDRSGKTRRRKLVRVVLDNSLRISPNSQLVLTAKETPTIIFTDNDNEEKIKFLKDEGVKVIQIAEGGRNLFGVLQELGKRDLQSVLVEGGAEIAGAFYDAKLIDKISFFIAPIVIGGRDAPTAIGGQGAQVLASAMRLRDVEIVKHGEDLEICGYPKWNE